MIYINEKLRIRKLDGLNLQLEEYRKGVNPFTKKEVGSWKWCGYYGDLKSAFLGALNKQLFDSADEQIDLKEVLAKIESARQSIVRAVDKLQEENFGECDEIQSRDS
jgi:hypothetical protein